jgi:hypothetical protein
MFLCLLSFMYIIYVIHFNRLNKNKNPNQKSKILLGNSRPPKLKTNPAEPLLNLDPNILNPPIFTVNLANINHITSLSCAQIDEIVAVVLGVLSG